MGVHCECECKSDKLQLKTKDIGSIPMIDFGCPLKGSITNINPKMMWWPNFAEITLDLD
jgi:hypothetical protein